MSSDSGVALGALVTVGLGKRFGVAVGVRGNQSMVAVGSSVGSSGVAVSSGKSGSSAAQAESPLSKRDNSIREEMNHFFIA